VHVPRRAVGARVPQAWGRGMTERCIVGPVELRLGRWETALADVGEVDAVITDPPYSARTHAGHDGGTRSDGAHDLTRGHRKQTRAINYECWTPDDVAVFVDSWIVRCGGWFCAITDDNLIHVWREHYARHDRVGFAAIPVVEIGSRVRLAGDGPCSWSCYIAPARPRTRRMAKWGTLPGAYVYTGHGDRVVMGGKRLDSMRDVVRDYTRPGDLVCDPCAGGATTLIAAGLEGRRAIGSEMDPATFAKACARLREYAGAFQQATLFDRATLEKPRQTGLDL